MVEKIEGFIREHHTLTRYRIFTMHISYLLISLIILHFQALENEPPFLPALSNLSLLPQIPFHYTSSDLLFYLIK